MPSKREFTLLLTIIQIICGRAMRNSAAPLEATLRSMYFAGSLEKKYGLNLELAMSMEDQVMPLGLASLWAGSGWSAGAHEEDFFVFNPLGGSEMIIATIPMQDPTTSV